MGVMEKFRASTKYILWLLILSFGLLWALADTNVFDAMMAGPRSLGEVNGKAITFEAYNQKVQNYSERYRYETGDAATSEMRAYYEDMAWDELVLDIIVKQKMDELGITVTDDELVNMITGPNPDPFIAQQFKKEDGSIDRAALDAAISAPENTNIWIMIEQQLRDNRRREKLSQYLQASVKVSDAEVAQEYMDKNSTVTFDFIRVPYNEIPDSVLKPTDAELKSFYNKEINRYQRKKTWKFDYVEFDLTPTSEDTLKTLAELQNIREELTGDTRDSLVFLQYGSLNPYAVTKVAKTEVKESYKPVLSVAVNQTTEIIKEADASLHILKKVAETKTEVSFIDYSAKVVADPLGTVDEKAKEADDFSYFASENSSFKEEAERRGYVVKNGIATEDTPFIAGLGQTRQTLNWLKGAKVSEVTQNPIELPKAYVVIQLTEILEAGARSLTEVRPQVERLYKTEMRKKQTADKINAVLTGNSNLVDIAKALSKEVKKAENVRINADVIPGVGREPIVLGKATVMDTAKVSSVISGEFAAYVIEVKNHVKADEAGMNAGALQQIRTELEQKRNTALSAVWVEQLKAAADIKDFRSVVLRNR
jgi:peptidyl-prolyl cis-trans isomerase D